MEQVHCNKITVEQTLDLRHAVLWPDKPLSHVCLPEDASGLHFGAFIADQDVTHQPAEPVAVISLFVERLPIDNNEPCSSQDHGIHSAAPMANRSHVNNENTAAIRFRKFACNPKYQGQGVGSKLLAHALSMASSELGTTIAWCDARTAAQDWYSKRGFIPFGSCFYKGTVEYVRMCRDI
ncbi:hypothetical protein BJ165DRAFT_1417590 [Panaeolus papilionaceus]|nr:hypothetical protein BJ165DRAFT_1417590 [Panaeolus papilionaceus]